MLADEKVPYYLDKVDLVFNSTLLHFLFTLTWHATEEVTPPPPYLMNTIIWRERVRGCSYLMHRDLMHTHIYLLYLLRFLRDNTMYDELKYTVKD